MPLNSSNRISHRLNTRAPTPGPYPIGSRRSPPFGRTTQRFFVEGEQHEAANWEDVVLPPDDEPDPSVHSGSFDKIPRRRSATIMLVALAALLVFGIIMSARFFLNTGRKVDAAKTAYTRTPPAAPVTKSAPVAAEPPAVPSESPSTAPGGGSTEEARTPPELVHGTAAAPGDEKVPESAAPAVQRPSRPHAKRSRSLENYVWSPTAQVRLSVISRMSWFRPLAPEYCSVPAVRR